MNRYDESEPVILTRFDVHRWRRKLRTPGWHTRLLPLCPTQSATIEYTCTIDQTGLRGGCSSGTVVTFDREKLVDNVIGKVVVVVGEEEGTFIVVIATFLVRVVLGSNDQTTIETVGVLHLGVTVPPIRAVLTLDLEAVSQVTVGRDGALGEPSNTVHERGAVLEHAMPVNGGALVEVVLDFDDDRVTFVGFDKWTRRLTVDEDAFLGEAIGCGGAIGDVPVKLASARRVIVRLALSTLVVWMMTMSLWTDAAAALALITFTASI